MTKIIAHIQLTLVETNEIDTEGTIIDSRMTAMEVVSEDQTLNEVIKFQAQLRRDIQQGNHLNGVPYRLEEVANA